MVCSHVVVFPHASVACQVRVATSVLLSVVFVTVLITCTVTALHVSVATGSSKLHATPICTVRSGWHTSTGAVASSTLTVWTQVAVLPQASVARHVRVASKVLPQWPVKLVTVLTIVMVALPQVSVAVGASNVQTLPHSTVLLG